MSCRLAVAVNRYPLKWKSLESRREYKGDHPGKRSRPTVVLHTCKKCNKEGEGWGTHVKKSSSTKCETEKKEKLKRKKNGHMKLYSYSSQALIRWQILFWMMAILQKRERKMGGGWRKGSCTLLYSGHGGKLQSSVTHLEYLTHCERHYFFLIKSFSGFWIAIAILTETAWDPASILGVKQEWRLCPFEGDDDESQTQSCFMKGESEKRWPIMCASREKTRGDHNSKTQVWSEVWVCVFSMCVATHVQNMHTWFK